MAAPGFTAAKTTRLRSALSPASIIPDPAHRPATRAAILQATSLCAAAAGRRQDRALRRQDAALRRMVVDASAGRRRLDDHGRLGRLPELAAPQGHSPGHQERHAGRRDRFRRARSPATFPPLNCKRFSNGRRQLDQAGALPGAQLPPGLRGRPVQRICQRGAATDHRRHGPDGALPRARRPQTNAPPWPTHAAMGRTRADHSAGPRATANSRSIS